MSQENNNQIRNIYSASQSEDNSLKQFYTPTATNPDGSIKTNDMYAEKKTVVSNYGPMAASRITPVKIEQNHPAPPTENLTATTATKDTSTSAPLPLSVQIVKPVDDREIVGMLVSASNGGKIETFPIRKGRNVIGRSVQADIRLMEDTVSETHAVIVVRHIHTPVDRYVFTITDKESTCGTFINGENADFNTYVIEDHTRIRFGNSYECIFLRLDTQFLNLKAAPGFAAVKEDDASLIQEKNQMGNLYAPDKEKTDILRTVIHE